MLQRCEHFPHTNHTRPSTTDTNNTVIESHAGQRWRSEPAGRSGLDTAPSLQSVRYRINGVETRAERRRARAAPADLEERRACQGAPASVKRVSRVALVRVRRRCSPLASRVSADRRVASSFLRPGKMIGISPSPGREVVLQLPAEPNAEVFDRRKRRVVLPSCTGCGAANTWVCVRTQHFLFIGCPRCEYLWSVRKPEPDSAST